jgi:mannosylfructose-phosphate synthase
MLTIHGIHQWDVVPGLPDTGGQNVFVNQLTDALCQLGFRVTIANRGGYRHPTTGEMRTGLRYRDESRRIAYLQDDTPAFVRKEDMLAHTPKLATELCALLEPEGERPELVISHYWDGARVGVLYNRQREQPAKHIWVPHSLGAVKKRNMAPETWADLRIDERIGTEREVLREVDGVAATSSLIQASLRTDYAVATDLFLPPCVDPERFHRRKVPADHPVWRLLADRTGLGAEELGRCRIVTEISRTDRTKRKDVLLRAFGRVLPAVPDALLVVAIDEHEPELWAELHQLIDALGIGPRVAVVGNVSHVLGELYSIAEVYGSPSVMEGFGMAVEEAAASQLPVVASDRVPFVVEYLLGGQVESIDVPGSGHGPLRWGEGGVVVPADDVVGFAYALERLLCDEGQRRAMAERAYHITVPHFTWPAMTRRFLGDVGVAVDR